jgi:glycosyltransferase involved in cell wall biosynthesis
MTPTLTVLIATHDRAGLLERALGHLNEARRPPDCKVDVLVAANACTDGTHALLDRCARKSEAADALPLRWFAEPLVGKSNALNSAMARLTSDWIAFVDDDHRVDLGYLESICRAIGMRPEVDLFCGRILPDWDGTEPAWVHDTGRYRIYPLPVPRYDLGDTPLDGPQEQAAPGGGNWILRTRLLTSVGPFSTTYGPVGRGLEGSEDAEWIQRAIRAGARLRYEPSIVQYHYVDVDRLTLRYLMRKAFQRSAGAVRLSRETVDAGPLPGWMIRKVVRNALALATPGPADKFRFHLVRLAATLGEIKGHWRARHETASESH